MILSTDIVVVGGGVAGTVAAAVLGRQGARVILIDPHERYKPLFKAEKIHQEQLRLLRKFGLFDQLEPIAGTIREVYAAYDGRIVRVDPIAQYGFAYSDMVHAFRDHLPTTVKYLQGYVQRIANSPDDQRVYLAGGEEISARLVVLSCGVSQALQKNLGLHRRVLQKDQCIVFGFSVKTADERPFDFDAVTCYPVSSSHRIDYLTLFNVHQAMRANMFIFRAPGDPWVRNFLQNPEGILKLVFPRLRNLIGEYRIAGKVDSGWVDLYQMDGVFPPGVAIIGDAFQSACPATGLGLNKIFTDIDVLAECLSKWLVSPGMGFDKLSDFYQNPRKRSVDELALQCAKSQRQAVISGSMRWRFHRFRQRLRWRLLGTSKLCEQDPLTGKTEVPLAISVQGGRHQRG
jgi:2-polyprenyl-6-methoxyphenol hydroxylase-like FAD-dependent oxidoreductase